MEFCIISPTSGLSRFATRSKRHMVLAHQYANDQAYAEFYFQRKAEGDFIMLDNGAYEDNYDEAVFLDVIGRLKPNVAVLPDIICNRASSLRSLSFLRKYHDAFPSTQWMYIPQGHDLIDWCYSLNDLKLFQATCTTVWVGLTRFLPTHVYPQERFVRAHLAQQIKARDSHIHIHAMGMADGDLLELRELVDSGVESCDSSAPVWRGWAGYSLFDRARESWKFSGTDVIFSAPIEMAYVPQIHHNLDAVMEVINGPHS